MLSAATGWGSSAPPHTANRELSAPLATLSAMATINQPTPPQPSHEVRLCALQPCPLCGGQVQAAHDQGNELASVQPCGCMVELPQSGAVSRPPVEFPSER